MRLQKYISRCGYTSRRKAEQLIEDGCVMINGVTACIGDLVSDEDVVCINGEEIKLEEKLVYIMLHKPVGIVTTTDDQFDRKTVLSCLEGYDQEIRVYPVGRLDYNTSGLLILTNDGDFTRKVTHPSSGIMKRYVVKVNKVLGEKEIRKIQNGIYIDGRKTSKVDIEMISRKPLLYEVGISEGRNREVRRLFEAVGVEVYSLKRISIGGLILGDLKVGSWRYLSKDEILKI